MCVVWLSKGGYGSFIGLFQDPCFPPSPCHCYTWGKRALGSMVKQWRAMVILRFHYVPGGPVSLFCSKRSVPWKFGKIFLCFQDLLRLVKFSYVALRYP